MFAASLIPVRMEVAAAMIELVAIHASVQPSTQVLTVILTSMNVMLLLTLA